MFRVKGDVGQWSGQRLGLGSSVRFRVRGSRLRIEIQAQCSRLEGRVKVRVGRSGTELEGTVRG